MDSFNFEPFDEATYGIIAVVDGGDKMYQMARQAGHWRSHRKPQRQAMAFAVRR
jgi:hypothetical protein